MADSYCPTVIQTPIPDADMTPLEALVLGEIFETDPDTLGRAPATYFFAPRAPADVIVLDRVEIARALHASFAFESRLNAFIGEAVPAEGPTGAVEIDMTGLDWEHILQDIVRRSPTLTHVTAATAFTSTKMRSDDIGGAASFITAHDIACVSTAQFLEARTQRLESLARPGRQAVYVCPKCGSGDVGVDATARWDAGDQQWVLGSTYDAGWCEACGAQDLDLVKTDPAAPPADAA